MASSREPENQPPERCSWPPRPQITWPQAVTLHQRLAGLGFQGRHDDGPGVPGAVRLQVPLGVEGGGAVPGAVLHGVGAGDARGIGVGRVVDRDTADDVFSLLGHTAGDGRGESRTVRGWGGRHQTDGEEPLCALGQGRGQAEPETGWECDFCSPEP